MSFSEFSRSRYYLSQITDRDAYNGRPVYGSRHYDLLNGAIFSDLERPLPPISRSHHYLMLNISETVRDTDLVSMEYAY